MSNSNNSINPALIAQLVQQVMQKQAGAPVTESMIDKVAGAAVQNATQPKKADTFLSGLAGVAKTLAPTALSLIPGGGAFAPMVNTLLSTMNDDEWFSHFTGNGAAFNQFLQVTEIARNSTSTPAYWYSTSTTPPSTSLPLQTFRARAGFVSIPTRLNKDTEFTANFMPQIVADIRRLTNNVLVDDVNAYDDAFLFASELLMWFYTMKKYLELSAVQPLNIPNITSGIKPIAPQNIAQFMGMVKSLEDYIRSTIRLPYAWTEYIRWRFGTVFLSDNTGKPALIMYDVADATTTNAFPSLEVLDIQNGIEAIKVAYVATGRAGADLKLAYNDHEQRLTVEASHYDEKEFNLRSNMDVAFGWGSFAGSLALYGDSMEGKELILDSRLDMNAAIQAVTISSAATILNTTTGQVSLDARFAAFRPYDINLFTYLPNDLFMGPSTSYTGSKISKGWRKVSYVLNRDTLANLSGGVMGFYVSSTSTTSWELEGASLGVTNVSDLNISTTVSSLYDATILPNLLASAQFHNRPAIVQSYAVNTVDGPVPTNISIFGAVKRILVPYTILSYDTAHINAESLFNIQRAAVRNLVRSDYKRKNVAAKREELRDGVKDLLEDVALPK